MKGDRYRGNPKHPNLVARGQKFYRRPRSTCLVQSQATTPRSRSVASPRTPASHSAWSQSTQGRPELKGFELQVAGCAYMLASKCIRASTTMQFHQERGITFGLLPWRAIAAWFVFVCQVMPWHPIGPMPVQGPGEDQMLK